MTTVDRPRTEAPAPVVARALTAAGLATVLIGVLLPMLDFFIVNVALPTMAVDLRASTAELELVVSGYATAYAVLLVVGGRLGDAFGRRRLFLVGMALFTLTSLLCGLAPTPTTLVVARVLQGASAALLVPQTLSTIQATGDSDSRARPSAGSAPRAASRRSPGRCWAVRWSPPSSTAPAGGRSSW
jgi:MFS family permease